MTITNEKSQCNMRIGIFVEKGEITGEPVMFISQHVRMSGDMLDVRWDAEGYVDWEVAVAIARRIWADWAKDDEISEDVIVYEVIDVFDEGDALLGRIDGETGEWI